VRSPKRATAVVLVLAFTAVAVLGFGQTEGKPVALGGKSKPEAEIAKRKFPWLLVGAIAVVGVVAAVILLKKKKTAPPSNTALPTGNVHVESTPAGAEIYLDGSDLGYRTEATIRGVPPGAHTVRLMLAGYRDYEQSVTVEAQQTAEVEADLTPALIQEPGMVRLPGGTFLMGSVSEEAYTEERVVHTVTLSGFEIGKFEVTQAEWVSVMGSNPSFLLGDRYPVERVDWEDAQAYIQKLNAATGMRYRLPTEAEWEYACRAGTTGDRYGDADAVAWHAGNSGGRAHEVGGKAPNAFGLYDMLGNAFEWCSDWYADYSPEPATNPQGPFMGLHRVLRGGSWLHGAEVSRASFRNLHVPSHAYDRLGFRLARD